MSGQDQASDETWHPGRYWMVRLICPYCGKTNPPHRERCSECGWKSVNPAIIAGHNAQAELTALRTQADRLAEALEARGCEFAINCKRLQTEFGRTDHVTCQTCAALADYRLSPNEQPDSEVER